MPRPSGRYTPTIRTPAWSCSSGLQQRRRPARRDVRASSEVLAHRPLGDPVPTRWLRPRPVEIRYIGDPPWASRDDPPRRRNRATWCGCARAAPLPDDPLFQVCATAYASEMTLLGSVLLAQRPAWAEDTVTERVFITLCGSARHFAPTTGCSTFRKPPPLPARAASCLPPRWTSCGIRGPGRTHMRCGIRFTLFSHAARGPWHWPIRHHAGGLCGPGRAGSRPSRSS